MHGRKSVLSIGMARGEFGELTRGEVTRFHCTNRLIAVWTICTNSDGEQKDVKS